MDQRDGHLRVVPGGARSSTDGATAAVGPGANRLTRWFRSTLGNRHLSVGLAALLLAVAAVLGAGHALAPGHGKTIMAAYLVGRRGRRRQALTIAATVTLTHTAGVLVLGFIVATSFTLAPQAIYRWLAVANGLLVAAVGGVLLRRALRGPAVAPHHHHHHHDHDHGHDHGHGHGHDHGHSHHHGSHEDGHTHRSAVAVLEAPPAPAEPDRTPDRRTILTMGFAGGMTPSPSAVVVLLGAAALGRAWYGVLLVLAYGAGMAAALTGVGVLLARTGDRLFAWVRTRAGHRAARALPIAAAGAVLAAGMVAAIFAAVR